VELDKLGGMVAVRCSLERVLPMKKAGGTWELDKPREPMNRSAALPPNWATAATEARRRRDDAVKQKIGELRQQRRQARAAVDATQEFSLTRKV
jgi:hypothetical protein